MNNIIYKYKRAAKAMVMSLAIPAAVVTMSGCSDYLDRQPLNDVILENYWTQKADVKSVLFSCYESLESEESVRRMGVWGELRSDNFRAGRDASYDVQEMLKENLLPTNGYTKWEVMYQTINRCNTVCHYAPQVQQRDPNYSYAEMKANIAEATFLRDLCYFYLIRTFRDVPMTFEPSIDDQTDYRIAPTPMKEALDILINDLEAVQGDAVKRYVDDSRLTNSQAATEAKENCSRVTRVAIYALIADLCLWSGNYDKCVEYCDKVIAFKQDQYKQKVATIGDLNDMTELYGIPLIREKEEGSTTCGNAYKEIFGDGCSFESLFELYFKDNQSVKNTYVSQFYSSSNHNIGNFTVPSVLCKDAALGNCKLFAKNDCRVYETTELTSGAYAVRKYAYSSATLDNTNVTDERSLKLSHSMRGNEYSNWIVYRLTDVLLMKAEALVMKGEDNYETAFCMVNAVNKRACNLIDASARDTLKFADYKSSREKMEQLVLDERHRELMFEGKRWYDLVRMALRDGDNQRLITEATVKYEDNLSAIKIRLADPNILFFPYNRDELKLNPYLHQNSAYGNTDDYTN